MTIDDHDDALPGAKLVGLGGRFNCSLTLRKRCSNRFNAGMRYQPDHDELMDAVLLELQIKKCSDLPIICGCCHDVSPLT
jgi:hypothetical protein